MIVDGLHLLQPLLQLFEGGLLRLIDQDSVGYNGVLARFSSLIYGLVPWISWSHANLSSDVDRVCY